MLALERRIVARRCSELFGRTSSPRCAINHSSRSACPHSGALKRAERIISACRCRNRTRRGLELDWLVWILDSNDQRNVQVVLASQVIGFVDACIDDESSTLQSNKRLNDVVLNKPFSNLEPRAAPLVTGPRFNGSPMQHISTSRSLLMNLHIHEHVH